MKIWTTKMWVKNKQADTVSVSSWKATLKLKSLGRRKHEIQPTFSTLSRFFFSYWHFFYSDIKHKNRFDLNNEYRYTLTFKVHYFCQLQISLNPLTIPTVSFLFHSILNNSSNSPEKVRPACKIQLVIISSKLNNYKPRTKTRRFSHNLGT